MDFGTIITTAIASLLASGILVGVVIYLGKRALDQILARDLESHKRKLESQAEQTITTVRHELQIEAIEHETRFTRLHEKRAEVIAQLYEHLEGVHRLIRLPLGKLSHLLGSASMTSEETEEISKRIEKLERYYYPNAIWLERDTCNVINELIVTYISVWVTQVVESKGLTVTGPDPKEDVARQMLKELAAGQRQLEDEFRRLLGMDMPKAAVPADTSSDAVG